MNIADIELVIVYGLPTTMAMLYQVYVQQFLRIDFHINNFIQMFGRAWRGDVDAMAQLIYLKTLVYSKAQCHWNITAQDTISNEWLATAHAMQ